ncbi:AraC family transcriptional regulator [Caulobacter radicis]|uniref:helix-turn-helix transcriptional regulator n=1 Tax=Caulobacter radicis TaxID=2172650 RepID=UPI000D567872|nr:AraC family transcriptional regulator [Caulobacter radicis]PVM90825.1 AraC family transcriptional regulator [Caulobacter radicis]
MSFLAVDTVSATPVARLRMAGDLAGEPRTFEDLREVLAALERSLEPDAQAARALVARASAIVVGVDARATAPIQGGLAPWQARKLRKHIDENLDGTLTTAALGELVALSASYFGRAFKATFGETPHAYITRRRLEAAKDLMLATRDPLSQIAYQCGFADQSHLCRLFRRSAGMAPQAWRRANRMAA